MFMAGGKNEPTSAGRVVRLLDYSRVVIANRTRIRIFLLLN